MIHSSLHYIIIFPTCCTVVTFDELTIYRRADSLMTKDNRSLHPATNIFNSIAARQIKMPVNYARAFLQLRNRSNNTAISLR